MTPQPKPAKRGPRPRKPIQRSRAPIARKRRPRPIRRSATRGVELQCQRAWSFLILHGKPLCERCLAEIACEAHHLIPRSRSRVVRWELTNGAALGRRCHDFVQEHRVANVRLAVELLGEDGYRWLCERAAAGGKPDYREALERLRAEIARRGLQVQATGRGIALEG
jgi:5-methylcytosine-specific restriction endonuclease McrA